MTTKSCELMGFNVHQRLRTWVSSSRCEEAGRHWVSEKKYTKCKNETLTFSVFDYLDWRAHAATAHKPTGIELIDFKRVKTSITEGDIEFSFLIWLTNKYLHPSINSFSDQESSCGIKTEWYSKRTRYVSLVKMWKTFWPCPQLKSCTLLGIISSPIFD